MNVLSPARHLILLLCLLALPALAADVSVTWTQPATNTDGSAIPESGAGSIASNRVEWGTCSGTAFGVKAGEKVVSPAATSTTVPNLGPQTWCFRAYATNTYGIESAASNAASRVVSPPTPNPPVVTTATIVRLYLRDNPSLVAGTVALGVECGDQAKGKWYAVDRANVKLNFIGRIARDVPLVAKCAASG